MSGTVPPYPVQAILGTGDFAGIPSATLMLWLAEAQLKLHTLLMGGQPVSLSYSQGDGSRSVSYTTATADNLRAHIAALKQAIGLPSGRRPIRPYFL